MEQKPKIEYMIKDVRVSAIQHELLRSDRSGDLIELRCVLGALQPSRISFEIL